MNDFKRTIRKKVRDGFLVFLHEKGTIKLKRMSPVKADKESTEIITIELRIEDFEKVINGGLEIRQILVGEYQISKIITMRRINENKSLRIYEPEFKQIKKIWNEKKLKK